MKIRPEVTTVGIPITQPVWRGEGRRRFVICVARPNIRPIPEELRMLTIHKRHPALERPETLDPEAIRTLCGQDRYGEYGGLML